MKEKNQYFRIGKIVKTQGLKGEFRVYPYTDSPERFYELEYFLTEKADGRKYYLERVREINPTLYVFKVEGIDRIEDVESLINKFIYVPRDMAYELDEDEYFVSDIIGFEVFTVDGKRVGVLKDVLGYSANDVYVIKSDEGREYMVPAVKKFVPEIDAENGKIIIDPIKGMID